MLTGRTEDKQVGKKEDGFMEKYRTFKVEIAPTAVQKEKIAPLQNSDVSPKCRGWTSNLQCLVKRVNLISFHFTVGCFFTNRPYIQLTVLINLLQQQMISI